MQTNLLYAKLLTTLITSYLARSCATLTRRAAPVNSIYYLMYDFVNKGLTERLGVFLVRYAYF